MILADNEYLLIATGERFRNADGRTRQDEIALCGIGERVELRREPQNPRDRMAVALFSIRDSQLGYLNREHAAWIGALIDDGEQVGATVHRIGPKGRPGSPLALTLLVTVGAQGQGDGRGATLGEWHA